MVTKRKRSVSTRLDEDLERRLEKASELVKRSRGALLHEAVDEMTRRILLDWAVSRHALGLQSFSELAEETGLAVEEIMRASGSNGRDKAIEMFLTSCSAVAEIQHNPGFLRRAEEAVEALNTSIA